MGKTTAGHLEDVDREVINTVYTILNSFDLGITLWSLKPRLRMQINLKEHICISWKNYSFHLYKKIFRGKEHNKDRLICICMQLNHFWVLRGWQVSQLPRQILVIILWLCFCLYLAWNELIPVIAPREPALNMSAEAVRRHHLSNSISVGAKEVKKTCLKEQCE